jgi:hypothetical protein
VVEGRNGVFAVDLVANLVLDNELNRHRRRPLLDAASFLYCFSRIVVRHPMDRIAWRRGALESAASLLALCRLELRSIGPETTDCLAAAATMVSETAASSPGRQYLGCEPQGAILATVVAATWSNHGELGVRHGV